MAVAFIADFPGGTIEDYEAVLEKMGLEGRLPAGAMYHAAGVDDAGLRVCDVWEPAEALHAFAETQIGPLTAERGMAEPIVRTFEVHQVRRTDPAPIEFLQVVTIPGVDAEGFAALDTAVLGPERAAPAGCVFHVNGKLGDDWCVMDYWSSKEIRDAFIADKAMPAMQAAGVEQPPVIEELTVHNSISQAPQAAGV
jgi:hypothetical protein